LKKIKLPDFEELYVRDKHHSPYAYFYAWIFKQLEPMREVLYSDHKSPLSFLPSGDKIDVTKVIITEEDDKKLDTIVKKWLTYIRARKDNIYMLKLNEGPSTYSAEPLESGYAYILDDLIIPRKK